MQRVFGGQVAGQALVAAGRTVPAERHVHSLHAYFLRPGDPTIPIVYEVDRIRDGRSFTTRRVVAVQHGKAIFHLSASFQVEEPGVDHQAADAGRARPGVAADAGRAARGRRAPATRRAGSGRARSTCGTSTTRPGCRTATQPTAQHPAGVAAGERRRCRTTRCCTSAP